MKNWRRNIVIVISVLLCAATVAVWVRSYSVSDQLRKGVGSYLFRVASYRGVVLLQYDSLDPGSGLARLFSALQWDTNPIPQEAGYIENGDGLDSVAWRKAGWIGFGVSVEPFVEGVEHVLVIPFWFVALLMLSPLGHLTRQHLRGRRRLEGSCCQKCGYDLRASKDRCPECGTPITTKTL